MKKNGFTLAETLITLVIVGIVAAITVPVLMQKHRRTYTETQLKSAYNILTQALVRAEADYGPRTSWEYDMSGYKNTNAAVPFVKTYMAPYLKLMQPFTGEEKALSAWGYKTDLKYADGTVFTPKSYSVPLLILQNGMFVIPMADAYPDSSGNYIPTALFLFVDVNGQKGPNVFQKDVFSYSMIFFKGETLTLGETGDYYTNKSSRKVIRVVRFDLSKIKSNCLNSAPKYNSYYCSGWIYKNGFKIPNDYPLL